MENEPLQLSKKIPYGALTRTYRYKKIKHNKREYFIYGCIENKLITRIQVFIKNNGSNEMIHCEKGEWPAEGFDLEKYFLLI